MLKLISVLFCFGLYCTASASSNYQHSSKDCPAEFSQQLCDKAKDMAIDYVKTNAPKMYSKGKFVFLFEKAPEGQIIIFINNDGSLERQETLPDGRVITIVNPAVGGGMSIRFDQTTFEVLKVLRGQ